MESKAEQFYPTYKSSERDILLVEFEEAQKIANGQNKVYAQVANILLAAATFLFTTFYKEGKSPEIPQFSFSTSVFVSIFIFISGAMLLRYFVDLQRQITINARKVVTLRTLLGLDYGNIQLTLPNWRVEGATNPFVIKYFNGWLAFKTTPFWLLTIFVNLVWWLAVNKFVAYQLHLYDFTFNISWYWGHLFITICYLYIFRANLNDRHETNFLNIVTTCLFPFLKFVDNFEYILYRAKLSYMELERLGVNYDEFKKVLVSIEDNRFHSHNGISLKSLVRAGLSRFGFLRRKYNYMQNGASTISMQLSRSLFIPSNQNKFFRKIAEIAFSIWLNKQFSKDDILKLYAGSVRYERRVLGMANAIKYFFGELHNKKLTIEEAFFLVERLSNITSSVSQQRIDSLLSRINLSIDKATLMNIYTSNISNGKLRWNNI